MFKITGKTIGYSLLGSLVIVILSVMVYIGGLQALLIWGVVMLIFTAVMGIVLFAIFLIDTSNEPR